MKKTTSETKQLVTVLVAAILLGLVVGPGIATLRARHVVTPAVGGKVRVDAEAFDFGELDVSKDGSHDFTFTNKGAVPLLLTRGNSTCRCTVGEIANESVPPGQSTTVRVTWKSKHTAGHFSQSVTINTNDPIRPEVILTVTGEFTEPLHLDHEELEFGEIAGDESVTRKARIFCKLSNPLKILGHNFTDFDLAKYFQVEIQPLSADDVKQMPDAVSGVLVKVTTKPGLPPGRFEQTILIQTNMSAMPEVRLPLSGSIGKDVSVVGAGWDEDVGVLNFGTIETKTAFRRQLLLVARGADAKNVRYNVVHIEPDFLKVKIGETELSDDKKMSRTMLTIEVPPQNAPASCMGGDRGKLGEIRIDTTSPQVDQLSIHVRFAVEDSNPKR